jgi:hypothetical protein
MSSRDLWTRPSSATLKLDFRVGESVLIEFARAHEPAAILRELIQNEYDAGGSRLEVSFGDNGLTIKGNGAPVDHKGWLRLSVIMGTGRINGSNDVVRPKVNGIAERTLGFAHFLLSVTSCGSVQMDCKRFSIVTEANCRDQFQILRPTKRQE